MWMSLLIRNARVWGRDPQDMVIPFRMVTEHAARAMRLQRYGVAPACEANLVVLDATTLHEAFQYQADRRYVILRGRLVAETQRTTSLTLE